MVGRGRGCGGCEPCRCQPGLAVVVVAHGGVPSTVVAALWVSVAGAVAKG